MACYAALLSLFHTLNQIKNHPRPPISLDQKQLQSLTQNLTFFQHFLESYPTQEDEHLESRIKAAAYAAEDVIETHVVDRIHDAGSNVGPVDLSQGLERVIQDMDLIKKEVMEIIQENMIIRANDHDHHQHRDSSVSTWQSSATPVFDDAMINQVLDTLTGGQSGLQIIPIVGMGGIGKTTFARTIYSNPLIVHHFDVLAWVTISQEYSRGKILQLLCQEIKGGYDDSMSEDDIGLIIYKHLWGRRYLIVMDDIWSVDAWDKVRGYFPDEDGSRIMITTRLSNLASELSSSHVFQMQFLDEGKSWDLLSEIVFGKQDCPIELENIGKEIARKCRGLPLSIVVIGGLLKNTNMTQAYWLNTLEDLNLIINLENDEYILRILRASYKELPMHLKPCFLYMGVFREDGEIKASMLIQLWVAEGILRPINDKSLEEVASEYLKELIDRNLVLVSELRWNGEAKLCKIHDLLRDVCLREAHKQKFICVVRQQKHHIPQDVNMERRICIDHENAKEEYSPEFLHVVESESLARSLLYKINQFQWDRQETSQSLRFRLLRVYSSVDNNNSFSTHSDNAIFEHANLRYVSLSFGLDAQSRFHSLCSLVWNLQTLKVGSSMFSSKPIIVSAIWEMPLLRHFMLYDFALLDPPNGEDNFVLENLQSLSRTFNFKFSEEVVKRIPNIRKLKVVYDSAEFNGEEELTNFCLNNLCRLQKLESLNLAVRNVITFRYPETDVNSLVSFPQSLKKLTLFGTKIIWEELTLRVGSLPLLQVLNLGSLACEGPEWETFDETFCSLKFLQIDDIYSELKYWETDSAHFPCLEHLRLRFLDNLEEIPSSLGDIPTLKSIRLEYCNRSAVDSARRIKDEQEENGNDDLQVVIVGTGLSDSANPDADQH